MDTATEGVDLEALVEATGISLVNVKAGLGMLPECSASTFEEARTLYEEAEKDSEAQEAALEKMIETLLEEISKITSFKWAKKACMDKHLSVTANLSVIVSRAALEKLLDIASTGEEYRVVCHFASKIPDLHAFAIQQWIDFSWRQFSQITTVEQAREAFGGAPENTPVQADILLRWLGITTTAKEVQEVYLLSHAHSVAQKSALKKLATFYPA